ncbi:MAG: winged helix-turn-helix transcriptional regulator [candidate division Zixibacteria bacterium]|nr:winged helix-turn-helix transcriptional regulator [candidate division Zixibacteria bacterium]
MQKLEAGRYAEIFKALGDETRVKIMLMLNTRSRSVSEIVDFFNLSQPTISRHLALLKQAGLVAAKREGQQVIYSLDEKQLPESMSSFLASFDCCTELFKTGKNK